MTMFGSVPAMSTLLLCVVVIPLIYRRVTGRLDLFEPIQLISGVFAMNFAIRALCYINDPTRIFRLSPYPYDDMFPTALWYATLGFVALAAGYAASGWALGYVPRRPRTGRRQWPERAPVQKIVWLLVIGCVATLVTIRNGQDVGGVFSAGPAGDATFLLQTLSQCINFAAGICAVYLAGTRNATERLWLRLLLFGLILPIGAAQALLFSSKSKLLLSVFAMIGVFNYAGRRRLRLATAVTAVAVILLLVFPAVNAYRSGTFRIGATRSVTAFVDSLAQLAAYLSEGGLSENVKTAVNSIVDRSHGVDSLSLLVKYGDHSNLPHRRDYLMIPAFAFVPRVLWPSKPINNTSIVFLTEFVLPRGYTVDVSTAPAFGIFNIGDLYVCFGFAGMLIGLFVIGTIYRFAYWFFDPTDPSNRHGIFMFVMLLWYLINGFEEDVPTVYALILKMVVVLWAVSRFVGRQSAPEAAEPAVPAFSGGSTPVTVE